MVFQKRLKNLKKIFTEKKLNALLVTNVSNITYLTGYANFSKDEREAYLLITKNKQYVITDGRYAEAVLIHIPRFELIERTIKNSLKNIFKNLAKKHKIKKIGIEENNVTVNEHAFLKKYFESLKNFSLSNLRSIKEHGEIDAIEKACQLGDKAFEYILKKIKKGVTEKEIAFEIELFIKKLGAELSFPSIVAFGKNSSVPHHQTSDQRLTTNDQIVLLDFGVKLNNYCSDMTRTVFFGKPTSEQRKIYQTVLTAQQKAIEHLGRWRSNDFGSSEVLLKAKDIDKTAHDYIIAKDYPTIPHNLGHGTGLEIHEAPRLSPKSKDILKPGMVFSIEPGIYIPGFGGVRIEDLVVLEPTGPRLLTKSPRDLTLVG